MANTWEEGERKKVSKNSSNIPVCAKVIFYITRYFRNFALHLIRNRGGEYLHALDEIRGKPKHFQIYLKIKYISSNISSSFARGIHNFSTRLGKK
jgi:hypothetical protein